MKELLVERLRIPSNTVHVVPHVLIGEDNGQEKMPEDEPLILFFGRLWEYKGLKYLIRAEPSITARVSQAKIAIAGRGRDFNHYRQMMAHPERFITYNEYVSDERARRTVPAGKCRRVAVRRSLTKRRYSSRLPVWKTCSCDNGGRPPCNGGSRPNRLPRPAARFRRTGGCDRSPPAK